MASPFQPLLERIRKRLFADPSDVVLEVDGAPFLAEELEEEWSFVNQLLSVSPSRTLAASRGLIVGERNGQWVAAWLGALERGVPWLVLSDHLPQGMITLLEKTWQPNVSLGSGKHPTFSPPPRGEPWVWAAFERPAGPLQVCTHQDFARRQAVWEQWLEGTAVGKVGWWLPCQHPDMPEVALYHLARGACLSHTVDEHMRKSWAGTEKGKPAFCPRGFTHLHLTAIQAANTRWDQAEQNLKGWIHGPCPEWIVGLHPGLTRCSLPAPTGQVLPAGWGPEDRSLLEIFEAGLLETDPLPQQRRALEEVVGQTNGVVACAWLQGPHGRVMKVWTAPGSNRGWIGAQVQQRAHEAFPDLETEWNVLPLNDLSADLRGGVDLSRVFMDMHTDV